MNDTRTSPSLMNSDHQKIEKAIKAIPKLSVADPADDILTPKHSVGYDGTGSDRKQLFEERRRLTEQFERFVAFDPNVDAVFAGALVQGNSLANGVLNPISAVRTPATISVNGLVSSDPSVSFSERLNDPTNASVRDAVSRILSQNLNAEQPARITYSKFSAHSVEEAFLRLEVSYSWVVGHVNGAFQFSHSYTGSRLMVRYVQNYYSVSCEPQTSPASFVSSKVKYSDFSHYIGPHNPPAYVSSVTFGRELWLVAESSCSETEMSATLDAAFGSGSANLTARQRQILNESHLQALVLGGGGTSAITVITGDKPEALNTYLRAGANYSKQSPGAVISYTVRYMTDNSVARVSSATDYTIRTSENAEEEALTEIQFALLTGSDDKDDDNHVSVEFTLQPANRVLYFDGDVPPRQPYDDDPTWHDNDRRPINFRLSPGVFAGDPDAKQVRVRIAKTGGAHWHFGFDLALCFSKGKVVPLAHHEPNDHNFGDDYRSDSWSFNIPWSPQSQNYLMKRRR